MSMQQILRQARSRGEIVEIDMIDGTEYHGYWVERVGRQVVSIGHGDGSSPPQDIPVSEIKEVRIVSC